MEHGLNAITLGVLEERRKVASVVIRSQSRLTIGDATGAQASRKKRPHLGRGYGFVEWRRTCQVRYGDRDMIEDLQD